MQAAYLSKIATLGLTITTQASYYAALDLIASYTGFGTGTSESQKEEYRTYACSTGKHACYLHSILVGLGDVAHCKSGVLGPLPVQVLPPQLGAAPMVAQHHLPPPLQLFRRGHGLCLCSHKRYHENYGSMLRCHTYCLAWGPWQQQHLVQKHEAWCGVKFVSS